ncbi:MAG: amino acid synthesis family protein [Burkholderiales bacterium]
MSLIQIRKQVLTIETIHHEGGPTPQVPLRMVAAGAVVRNPYAGRYEADLLPFMAELRELGRELAEQAAAVLGKERVEAYGKAAIVGTAGEIEHGAVWHEAGGWAMRAVLGEPKAIVPAAKAVAATGYRLMVPLHYIHAAYVRSHFNAMEVGVQDGPRPDEIFYALVMADGGRVHARLGGLTKEQVRVHDGQR